MKRVVLFLVLLGLTLHLSGCKNSSQEVVGPTQLYNQFNLAVHNSDYETFSTQLALNSEVLSQDEFLTLREEHSCMGSSFVSLLIFSYPVESGSDIPFVIECVETEDSERPYAIVGVTELPKDLADQMYEILNS